MDHMKVALHLHTAPLKCKIFNSTSTSTAYSDPHSLGCTDSDAVLSCHAKSGHTDFEKLCPVNALRYFQDDFMKSGGTNCEAMIRDGFFVDADAYGQSLWLG